MRRCTIDDVKRFFLDKEDKPCPLTGRLVGAGYQQVSGGYIDRAKKEDIIVDYQQNSPSQYWHLMSYCGRCNPSKTFPRSIVCGELLFWMAEVSNSVPKKQLKILLDNIINNPLYIRRNRPFYDRTRWNREIHKVCFDSICSVVECFQPDIPKQVIEAAANEIRLGGHIVFVAEYKGEQVYSCSYDEAMIIGLPIFYLWNGDRVKVVDGIDGGEYLLKLIKEHL